MLKPCQHTLHLFMPLNYLGQCTLDPLGEFRRHTDAWLYSRIRISRREGPGGGFVKPACVT